MVAAQIKRASHIAIVNGAVIEGLQHVDEELAPHRALDEWVGMQTREILAGVHISTRQRRQRGQGIECGVAFNGSREVLVAIGELRIENDHRRLAVAILRNRMHDQNLRERAT